MNNFSIVFWIIFALLFFIIAFCDRKYNMLRDTSTAVPRPYSWSRVQLAWWTLLVLSAFITIICCSTGHQIPTLNSSTLVLLGITAGTTAAASLIDSSDQQNPSIAVLSQNSPSQNFFLDILSDNNGVSLNRLQAVLFNFVFGIWFINYVLCGNPCDPLHPGDLSCASHYWDYIIPFISQNNLILLGLSSATYAALKTNENKPTTATPAGNGPAAPPSAPAGQNTATPPATPPPPVAQPDPATDASGNPIQPANG